MSPSLVPDQHCRQFTERVFPLRFVSSHFHFHFYFHFPGLRRNLLTHAAGTNITASAEPVADLIVFDFRSSPSIW
jgi:hypothetical protein